MNKLIPKYVIFFITFFIGIVGFYSIYFCQTKLKSHLEEANKLQPQSSAYINSKNDEEFDPWKLPENFSPLKKGEFFIVGHGCGNGYVDGWLAYDGSKLSEGFNTVSSKDFEEEIAQADRIIERVENYPNKDGNKGLRVIVQGKNKETGKTYYSILWFGRSNGKHFGRYYLNAPNLGIGLELEKWLYKEASKLK